MNPLASRIALIVGHTQKRQGAPGAYPIASSEYLYNTGLAELAAQFARSRAHEVEIFFRDGGGIAAAYDAVAEWEADCAIELHFNAFNGQVAGTETLYCDDQDHKRVHEFEFATLVQQHMCRVFERSGRGDRGLKKRPLSAGERGYFSVNQLFHIPSVLVEPFFGDNREEAKLAVERKQELAEGLVLAVEEWKQSLYLEREKEVAVRTAMTATAETSLQTPRVYGFHMLPVGSAIEISCDQLTQAEGVTLRCLALRLKGTATIEVPSNGGVWLSQGKKLKFVLKEPGDYQVLVLLASSSSRPATASVSAARILPGNKSKNAEDYRQNRSLSVSGEENDFADQRDFQASVV